MSSEIKEPSTTPLKICERCTKIKAVVTCNACGPGTESLQCLGCSWSIHNCRGGKPNHKVEALPGYDIDYLMKLHNSGFRV